LVALFEDSLAVYDCPSNSLIKLKVKPNTDMIEIRITIAPILLWSTDTYLTALPFFILGLKIIPEIFL
jgi:hypothetical protein